MAPPGATAATDGETGEECAVSWPTPSGGTGEGGSWGYAGLREALDMVSGQYRRRKPHKIINTAPSSARTTMATHSLRKGVPENAS